jgi:hypothetical protein
MREANMTDARETLWFKPVPEGYVFQAPNPWIFARRQRFFLVDEAQKAQLLAVLTARSQSAALTIRILSFLAMFGASGAAIAFIAGGGDHSLAAFSAILIAMLVSMYLAFLIAAGPTRRVQPLLSGLSPTDQRITAADRRAIAAKQIWLPSRLILVAIHMILSAMFFVQAAQKTGGNPANILHNVSTFCSAFAACCFAFSSISLLISALRARKQGQLVTVPADQRVKKILPMAFVLVIEIALLGVVVYAGQLEAKTEAAAVQRREKSAEISKRQSVITERVNKLIAASASMKARDAANSARLNTLIGKLNHPTVRCETPASTECAERARQEKQAIEADIVATNKQAAALAKENAGIAEEVADIKAALAAIRVEIDANK